MCWDGLGQSSSSPFASGGDRYSRLSSSPPLPIFSPSQNLRSLGGDVASDGDFLIFEGNRYSRKGFLFKSFAMSAVVRVPEGVVLMATGNGEAKLSPSCSPGPRAVGYLGLSRVILESGMSLGSNSHRLSSLLSWAVTLTFVHFLLFPLSLGAQITEGVKPTLSELEKFEDQPEGIDLEVVTESTGIWSPSVT